ncbi:hypothetical protein HZH66_012478 [Vespula vulgaris]|uniref:Uncharacterized protein n=1 Tax=Vespula vulgaris TaxID=7454 RepID=A0A834MV95_VESVU|nr:hypothetical protein HZH66_012478 [Vespula vulgaris]
MEREWMPRVTASQQQQQQQQQHHHRRHYHHHHHRHYTTITTTTITIVCHYLSPLAPFPTPFLPSIPFASISSLLLASPRCRRGEDGSHRLRSSTTAVVEARAALTVLTVLPLA